MAAFSLERFSCDAALLRLPARPAAGAAATHPASRSKGSTLSGVGFSKERISQYRKQGLSDERISKLWQDTLKMRALMKKRKEQGVSDLEAGVSRVMEERPGTPRPGVRQAVQRRMEQIPQCRLETVDPDFSCPHRYWKGGGSCVTCSSAPAMRCVMWPVVSAALFLAAARVPQAPDFPDGGGCHASEIRAGRV